jgi:glycosyltransferase involved in cell wall biosynthesis
MRPSEIATDVMRLSMVTIGAPVRRTGGDRYDRVMAGAASDHGAAIRFTSIEGATWPEWFARAALTLHAASDRSDAILLDSLAAAPVAPWLRLARRPVIVVVHQRPGGVGHGPVRSRIQTALDRVAYRRTTGAIVAADGLVDDLGRIGVPADRVRVVYPGCDVPVAPGPPLDLRKGRGASILCVANWSESKGIVELLDAFAELPDGAATLWLIGSQGGDRRYAARVRRRLASPELSHRVVATGTMPIDEVGRFYRSADIFAMCSTVDAYGTAWTEALRAGLPLIGWRTANLPALAEHGREALMPAPGDRRALAEAIRTIATDPAVRARLADGARRRAETLPTWERSAELFFAAVRQLLDAPTTTRR